MKRTCRKIPVFVVVAVDNQGTQTFVETAKKDAVERLLRVAVRDTRKRRRLLRLWASDEVEFWVMFEQTVNPEYTYAIHDDTVVVRL
jgi:hypothetical protein